MLENGTKSGDEWLISTIGSASADMFHPRIGVLANGDVVTNWFDSSSSQIVGKIFQFTGTGCYPWICSDCYPDCQVCNFTTCVQCLPGKHIINPDSGSCGVCATEGGYFVNGVICSACPPQCRSCSSTTTCTACFTINGYFLEYSSYTTCAPCDVNNGFRINGERCEPCST